MWRPDGWEEILKKILAIFNVTDLNSEECRFIEAGADAILVVLRKQGHTPESLLGLKTLFKNYTVVFIPPDEPAEAPYKVEPANMPDKDGR